MAFKSTGASQPDNTHRVVGSEGDAIDQEATSGKQVIRQGGDATQADIDVGSKSSPIDLIADGDFESANKNAGGATALAGHVLSDDGNTFSVSVEWLDNNNNSTITDQPSALTDVTDVKFNLVMRSDRYNVTITDTQNGAQNNIHGSINSH